MYLSNWISWTVINLVCFNSIYHKIRKGVFVYILFSAELCHLICSIFSKNPFLSTTRERGFNFVHRSFQFPNVYTQNHCFSPPWYVLEDKAATWDESSSRSVLSNLQTLQFLFISWMGIWRQRCHLPVHEQTVSDKYQITTLVLSDESNSWVFWRKLTFWSQTMLSVWGRLVTLQSR